MGNRHPKQPDSQDIPENFGFDDNPDILENFDFEKFLQSSDDTDFKFEPDTFESANAVESRMGNRHPKQPDSQDIPENIGFDDNPDILEIFDFEKFLQSSDDTDSKFKPNAFESANAVDGW